MKKKLFLLIVATVLLTTLLSGCSRSEAEERTRKVYDHIIIIDGGTRDGFPTVNYSYEVLQNEIYNTVYNYGQVTQITSEGIPTVAHTFVVDEPSTWVDKEKRGMLTTENSNDIVSAFMCTKATTPEVDLLAAL